MANEITVTAGLRVSNGFLKVTPPTIARSFDQTTARGGGPGTLDIGTSEETVSFGDCVPGYILAVNQDTTNFVKLRFATTAEAITLDANGGVALFKITGSVTLYAIADTAACKVNFTAVNV